MDEQIKQIAERLYGLREVLELTAENLAKECDIPVEDYRLAESGEYDISVSMLQKIARTYGITLDALMFGEEPKMNTYFLTRAGKGVSIERTKAYKYEALAAGFINRKADPFIVTVEPKPDNEPMLAPNNMEKWTEHKCEGYHLITQKGGATLGYSPNSGIKIIYKDGYAFKDLNGNGKLDIYEDWRQPIEKRVDDLVSKLSIEEIAGLMLYSNHGCGALPSLVKNYRLQYQDRLFYKHREMAYRHEPNDSLLPH